MITFCIPTKNNLRYLKNSVRSIKQNQFYANEIIVFIDSDNDGTEKWLNDNDITYVKNDTSTPKGIAYGYNRCIELATMEIVMMFHADMFMGKSMDKHLLEIFDPNKVISATRIEPSLHPSGNEKIIKDLGMYPEDFKEDEFNKFVDESKNSTKVTNGIFAPWLCSKKALLDIGLHDESLHSYYEDSDIFNRMLLRGMTFKQSWSGMVYHLTCRGGVFQDGVEKKTSDKNFYSMQNRSQKMYLRKWGSWIHNDGYQHPIILPRYDIGFNIKNCNRNLIELLEPWCDNLDPNEFYAWGQYAINEQKNSAFNITSKFKSELVNDIVVSFDATKFGRQDQFDFIKNLSQILMESGEVGEFEYDIFNVKVNRLIDYRDKLIKNEDFYKWKKIH